MPRKCCVPGCRGNYDDAEKVSVFKFPTESTRQGLWLSKIPRADFTPTSQSVVCAKHFSDQFLIRFDSVTRPDGSVLTVQRSKPKLSDDAYPSIFPNCPSYLSDEPARKRKTPDERHREAQQRDEESFGDWLEKDKIKTFSDFGNNLNDHVSGTSWIHRLHNSNNVDLYETESPYWSFYYLQDSPNSKPAFISAIRVHSDLQVEIFKQENTGIVPVPKQSLKWLFGQQSLTLTSWSQFDTMLSHFSSTSVQEMDVKQKIQVFVNGLQNLYSDESAEETDEHGEDQVSELKDRLSFLVEQLKLLISPVRRYSSETLLWAFQIFAAAPRTYSLLRNTHLTLPHTSYLKRLSSVFTIGSGLKDGSVHDEYLKQKCQSLSEDERMVILMLDEIHVAHQVSYKEGKLEGTASNSLSQEASTAQVFMISSLLCKSKDVVGIVPVKNLNADLLYDMLLEVLKLLHSIGYSVVCVISDNNRVNRNAFTKMCGGELKLCMQNPYSCSEKLFFLFDTVHIFKCIRNNWLAQKDVEKTFQYPSFESSACTEILKASFSHLRKLYSEEKSSALKLAPALNQKALYPTATEKQNVKLMLKVFDQRNVFALNHFEKLWHVDTRGTREFLDTILRLWNIVNVKHPHKARRLRNDDFKVVTSISDLNMQYMKKAVEWLQEWQKLNLKPREGTLSNETMTALDHTLRGLQELSSYLLNDKKFKYILLGKFQTDNLEFRFSQYRQMSGCNFHVSVQQLLEGEKKLKLISVLKLVSASKGTLTLKDVTEPLAETVSKVKESLDQQYTDFLPLIPDCDNIELTDEQLKALVFVSGYAVSKVLPRTNCDDCKNDLRLDKTLHVEGTNDCYTYLSALDRGGLVWPSDLAVSITTEAFKVFQVLVGKDDSENKFLQATNHRTILLQLSLRRITDTELCQGKCEECGVQCEVLAAKCIKPAVNIFLNNYSKSFCDQASSANTARKVKTFTKRI